MRKDNRRKSGKRKSVDVDKQRSRSRSNSESEITPKPLQDIDDVSIAVDVEESALVVDEDRETDDKIN